MNQKLKTILIVLLALPHWTQAQEGKIELGIEGGPSLTNLRGPQEKFKYNGIPLGFGGITFQYHFSKMISLKTGLSYDPKAFTATFEIDKPFSSINGKHSFSRRLDYLTLPVMIRFQVGKKVRFFVNAGGYLGILLVSSTEGTTIQDNEYYSHTSFFSYKSLIKDLHGTSAFDFGASGGLGIGIPIKNRWTISLEARGNLGLANIQNNSSELYQNRGTANTYSTALLLGVSYWLNPSDERDSFTQSNRFEVGIEGGPNNAPFLESKHYSYSDGTGHSTIHAMPSYSGGLSFQWNSRKHVSLRTGLMYQKNDYSFTNNYSNASKKNNSGKHIIEYLTIPVMTRATFGQKVHFFLNAGLFVSIATRNTETIAATSNKIPHFNPINFGAVGGFGMGIPIKKRIELSLEIRSHMAITNSLSKSPNTNYPQTMRINTLNALLGISYKLGFRSENK